MKNITWIRRIRICKFREKASLLSYHFLLVAIVSLALLVGCSFKEASSEKVDSYKNNFEIIGSEKEKILGEISEDIFFMSDRMNHEAKEHHLTSIAEEGEVFSLPTGRYQISGSITGNVYIYDSKGDLLFHNILGSIFGVPRITIDLKDSYQVKVDSGLDELSVIPYAHESSSEITAGVWFVGTDIEAGEYTITGPEQGGYGYMQIIDPEQEQHRVYEIIGGEFSSTESKVTLSEGQVIKITKIPWVNMKAE